MNDGKTPYEAALATLGEDTLKAFQLKPIAPNRVHLTPTLICFNHQQTDRHLLSDWM